MRLCWTWDRHFSSMFCVNLTLKNNFQDRSVKCLFFVEDQQVVFSLGETLSTRKDSQELNVAERVVNVTYQPQAVFRVDSVTRCTSSMPGHGEAVVAVSFSPDGKWVESNINATTAITINLTFVVDILPVGPETQQFGSGMSIQKLLSSHAKVRHN